MRFLIILLFAVSVCGACHEEPKQGNNESSEAATTPKTAQVIAPNDFFSRLQSTPQAQLLDVRTPGEVALGMIPNCTNIDFNDERFKDRIAELDKGKPVFVYCAKGGRSGMAAKMLTDMGFAEVYDLQGGFTQWQDMGLESVMPE